MCTLPSIPPGWNKLPFDSRASSLHPRNSPYLQRKTPDLHECAALIRQQGAIHLMWEGPGEDPRLHRKKMQTRTEHDHLCSLWKRWDSLVAVHVMFGCEGMRKEKIRSTVRPQDISEDFQTRLLLCQVSCSPINLRPDVCVCVCVFAYRWLDVQ